MNEDYVSVEAAGRTVGVSPRTVREWILQGKLPAFGSQRGKLVRLADVIAVAGTSQGVAATEAASAGEDALLSTRAVEPAGIEGILEELRDGVLWPLAERVELLARENGRLAAERDAAVTRAASDLAFVERLVALLQEELAAAHQRIARLEAELAQVTAERDAALERDAAAGRTGRRRLGQGAPGSPLLALGLPGEQHPTAPPPGSPAPAPARRWPWQRR